MAGGPGGRRHCLSLRGVISAIAALSVAAVAALTLGLTLKSSLHALLHIGKDHAMSMLANALVSAEHLLGRPQETIVTLQNFTLGSRSQWPSDDETVLASYTSASRALFLQEQLQLQYVLLFGDNTRIQIISGGGLINALVQRMSSWTAANFTSANQTFLNPVRSVRYVENMSSMPEDHPGFDRVNPVSAEKHRESGVWDAILFGTGGGGTTNLNGGVIAATGQSVDGDRQVVSFIVYLGALYREGDAVGDPFALAAIGVDFVQLNDFMRRSRATPSTEAFAMDNQGYLMGSSMARSVESITNVSAGTPAPVGCANTNTASSITGRDLQVLQVCRSHASAYGYAPLSALVADRTLAFASIPTVRLLDVHGALYFAASATVPQQFAGWSPQLMLLMPEEDVIGEVVRAQNTAIGITCAVFVVTTGIIFAAISLLLAPLSHVADRMVRAANFEDDEQDASVSAMAEVAQLQEAYYAMNDELNRIRAYVPQAVLAAKREADDSSSTGGGAFGSGRKGAEDDEAESGADDPRGQSLNNSATADSLSQATYRSFHSRRSRLSRKSGPAAAGTTKSSAGANGVASPLLQTSVTSKPVAVLVANARGFGAFASKAPPYRVAEAVERLVDVVNEAVVSNGGVLGAFHGDQFTATFNSVTPCVAFMRKAVAAALKITEVTPQQLRGASSSPRGSPTAFSTPALMPCSSAILISCGVASGTCLIGNVGSAAAKCFSTMGPAFTQALVLERLTRMYGDGCRLLTTARVCTDVATTMRIRFIDIVPLPGKIASLIGTVLGPIVSGGPAMMDTDKDAMAAENWLYLVNGESERDPDAPRNEAFTALYRMDLEACAQALQFMTRREETTEGTCDALPEIPRGAADGSVEDDDSPRARYNNNSNDEPPTAPAAVNTSNDDGAAAAPFTPPCGRHSNNNNNPASDPSTATKRDEKSPPCARDAIDERLVTLYESALADAKICLSAPPVTPMGAYYDDAVAHRSDRTFLDAQASRI